MIAEKMLQGVKVWKEACEKLFVYDEDDFVQQVLRCNSALPLNDEVLHGR